MWPAAAQIYHEGERKEKINTYLHIPMREREETRKREREREESEDEPLVGGWVRH
jgi:hypothetical protein